jgi:hypothetical protein
MPVFLVQGREFAYAPTAPPPSGDIVIEVNFATTPTVATSAFAPLKFNKQGVFNYELDDRSPQMRDIVAFFSGGVAPESGTNYPGKTFTDGCGNNIKWRAAIATNARLQSDNSDWVNFNSCLSWAEMASLINKDFMIENHGYYHNITGTFNNGTNQRKNINDNTIYIYQNLLAQGVQFRPRIVVVPNHDDFYATEGQHLKYLATTTQGALDGYTIYPDFVDQQLTITSFDNSYRLFNRSFKDAWDASAVTYYNGVVNGFLSGMSSSTLKMWRLGGHYFDPLNINEWNSFVSTMNYLDTQATDRVWVTTLQEYMEYMEVKAKAIKVDSRVANKLTITISLANISEQNRFRDMSLNVTSDAAISSVVVTGADSSSYNASTKLINVFKKKTTGFHDPSLETDLAAPTLTIDYTSGDRVNLNWTAITNAENYVLERATNSTFTTALTTVYTGPNLTFLNTGLSGGTSYFYRVKATATLYYDSNYSTSVNPTTGARVSLSPGGDLGINNFAIAAGNTYEFQAGSYSYIYFTGRNGTASQHITLINAGGQVVIQNDLKLENCSYIDVTGTGHIPTTYGFKSTNPSNPTVGNGLAIKGISHHLTMEWFDVDLQAYLILCKNEVVEYACDTSYWWPARIHHITLRNLRGTNLHQDAMYMGSSDPYGKSRPVLCTPTTSPTSVSIPTTHPSTVNIIVGTGLSTNAQTGYAFGQRVLVSKTTGVAEFRGTVASYNAGTGALQITTTSNTGTGSFSGWTVNTELLARPTGLSDITIHDCIINNIGRTAVQAGGWDQGTNKVYNMTISNCGYELNDQQGAGIAMGSGCQNIEVYNNTIDYTFKMPIYGYHYGLINVHDNTTSNTGKVIVSGVTHVNPDVPSIFFNTFDAENPSTTDFIISNNTFGTNTSALNVAIQFYTYQSLFDYGTNNYICNNTFGGHTVGNSDIDKSQPIANGNTVQYTLGCP